MPYITHDDNLIYGLGSTGTDSRVRAQTYFEEAHIHLLSDYADSTEELGSWMLASSIKITPCTDTLAKSVTECGGACGFQIVDGVADVCD